MKKRNKEMSRFVVIVILLIYGSSFLLVGWMTVYHKGVRTPEIVKKSIRVGSARHNRYKRGYHGGMYYGK